MLVQSIIQEKKNRVKIILDSGFAFVLYKGELCSYGIEEGKELSKDNLDKIMNEVLPKRACKRAMNLLKVRPYSVKGLLDKLKEGEYPEAVIQYAIDYVSSYGYLDDGQYARDYIYTYKDRKNKNRLFSDLIQKGISKDLIIEAYEEEMGDDSLNYEEEQIRKLLNKKGYFDREFTYEEKGKLLAALYRKGYSPDMCQKIMKV